MIYTRTISLCVIAGALALSACVTARPKLTQLQIEAMQTSSFEADKDTVYASVLSVFQTLGYTISESDKDAGLIVAESLSQDDTDHFLNFLDALFTGGRNREEASARTIANAFIEPAGEGSSRVRINLVRDRQSSKGTRNSQRVLDGKFYQNAFAQIGDAIFVRQGSR